MAEIKLYPEPGDHGVSVGYVPKAPAELVGDAKVPTRSWVMAPPMKLVEIQRQPAGWTLVLEEGVRLWLGDDDDLPEYEGGQA